MRTSYLYLSIKVLLAYKISTSGIVIANEGWFLCSRSSLPVAEKPILKAWMGWTKSRMSPPAHSTAEEEAPANLWLLFSWNFRGVEKHPRRITGLKRYRKGGWLFSENRGLFGGMVAKPWQTWSCEKSRGRNMGTAVLFQIVPDAMSQKSHYLARKFLHNLALPSPTKKNILRPPAVHTIIAHQVYAGESYPVGLWVPTWVAGRMTSALLLGWTPGGCLKTVKT